jgi:membrane protease YdiL (CAAX protease family)
MGQGSTLLALVVAALLVAPALFRPASRPWAVAFLATLALCLLLPALSAAWPGPWPRGARWNWSGQLLALLGTLGMAALLVQRAGLSWREMGFTWTQRPGSLRPSLLLSAVVLVGHFAWMSLSPLRLSGVTPETWLYQASMPGLVEEALFRGVLLALLDRAFVARRQGFGISLGWGAAVVTLVFLALRGVRIGHLTGVLPAALLFLWLRQRTGSLVMPIAVHNLWNLSVHAAHL